MGISCQFQLKVMLLFAYFHYINATQQMNSYPTPFSLSRYDTAERIPDGSIQRAGENVMTILQALGLSPLVGDPTTDKHGKVVFFDILGLFSVVYPERLAVILNSLVVLGSAVSLYSGISLKKQQLGSVENLILLTISVSLLFPVISLIQI